jgi:shikimate dehydrogenase
MTSPALQDIIALLGCPAAGNPAQYLFERAIEAAGLDCRFLSVDVDEPRLTDALSGVAAMGFRGCLLSGPLRSAALPLVAIATPAASFAGAVNLIERKSGQLTGHMTAGRGLVEALRAHINPSGTKAVVIGAGSRGRAAALELSLAGAAGIVIADRDPARAASLVESLEPLDAAAAWTIDAATGVEVPADVDIVVVATSGGKDGLKLTGLRGDLVVADCLLASEPSAAGRQALESGGCLVDGLEIHATQTAIDFHELTGVEADPDMLRDALDEFLS